jgi:hypothetical protein
MKNKTNNLSKGKTSATHKLQVSHPSSAKEAMIIALSFEKKLPVPAKEFPVSKWTMPVESQGYIQGHENDCL